MLKRFFYKFKLNIINLMVWVLCSFISFYISRTLYKLCCLMDMCIHMWIYFDQIEKINIDLAKKLVLTIEIPFLGFLYFLVYIVAWFSDIYYSEGEIVFLGDSLDHFLWIIEVFFIVCIFFDLNSRILIKILESWL